MLPIDPTIGNYDSNPVTQADKPSNHSRNLKSSSSANDAVYAQPKDSLDIPDAQRRQSDPTFDTHRQTTKPDVSFSPMKGRKHFFRLPIKSKGRADRRLSEAWNGADSGDLVSLPIGERCPSKSEDCVSIEAGMMVKVLTDFNAVREDEITVLRGEVIQVLSCNSVRGFLVHRAATNASPAAEGWVPSVVLLPPPISYCSPSNSPTHPNPKKSWRKLRKTPSDNQMSREVHLPSDKFPYSSPPLFQKRMVALINPYNPEPPSGIHYLGRVPSQEGARLLIPDSPDAPIKFVTSLNNVAAPPGSPVEMSCRASGQGILAETINVRWFGPSGELTEPRFELEQHRDGTFKLHFVSARSDDAGEYTCVVTTGEFSVSCSAILRIMK